MPREVCDFYQSRITRMNIGDIHHDDLLSRADKHCPKLIDKLAELLGNVLGTGRQGSSDDAPGNYRV